MISEIIRSCSYNYDTKSWIWIPSHPISMEERATVLLSKFLQFREVCVDDIVYEAVELLEEPLREHLKQIEKAEGTLCSLNSN